MASLHTCEYCGKANPELFVFSGLQKVFLCTQDIGSYMAAHSGFACSLFPIAAMDIISKPSDQGAYLERVEAMDQGNRFLDEILEKEGEQWRAATVRAATMEEETVDEVRTGFKTAIRHLKDVHEAFLRSVQAARGEFQTAKLTKSLDLSLESASLLQVSKQGLKNTPDFFNSALQSVVQKVRKDVSSCVSLNPADFTDFLTRSFDISLENAKFDRKKTEKHCEICGIPLNPRNYKKFEDHKKCEVCFACIAGANNIRLLCPICKFGYSLESKRTLKMEIPNFFSKKKPETRKKRKRREYKTCVNCNEEMETAVHTCVNGGKICLLCCQNRIIRDGLGNHARCPECKVFFAQEVYDEFDNETQNCTFCGKELYLATVAHCCIGENPVKMSCEVCIQKQRRGNRCERCGGNLERQRTWGSFSETGDEESI